MSSSNPTGRERAGGPRFLNPDERAFASNLSKLGYCNPFSPERIEYEHEALGEDFVDPGAVWSLDSESNGNRPNIVLLMERSLALIDRLRERLTSGARASTEELMLYEDAVLFLIYNRYSVFFQELIVKAQEEGSAIGRVAFFAKFARDFEHYLKIEGVELPTENEPAHVFACFCQIRRAFHHTFAYIIGSSMPAARLRASVWESIFTYDIRRFRRLLYDRMGDITCLITGPSGTGKELVARAIGLARYIPFDPKTQTFAEEFFGSFHALNLSALSPTLIESELFGHRRGSFTGAVQDRVGRFELCGPMGTIFLDEIGELDPAIQVKLLRVLQARTFERIGETEPRKFEGKIIAATNRDLAHEMREGRFREDFYYRLCSDIIRTPSLREQLADSPDELGALVRFIVKGIVGEEEASSLAAEVEAWIDQNLGRDYPWQGNVRELEQCIRNVLIRKSYLPPDSGSKEGAVDLAESISAGSLTADQLLSRYCTIVYAQTGNYQETARRLQLDHRTVKSKIDAELLERIQKER